MMSKSKEFRYISEKEVQFSLNKNMIVAIDRIDSATYELEMLNDSFRDSISKQEESHEFLSYYSQNIERVKPGNIEKAVQRAVAFAVGRSIEKNRSSDFAKAFFSGVGATLTIVLVLLLAIYLKG